MKSKIEQPSTAIAQPKTKDKNAFFKAIDATEAPFFKTHSENSFFKPTPSPVAQAKANATATLPSSPKSDNQVGLPDNLKAGIENVSGLAMDDVKVHYNSDRPAQLNALAFAQGVDIHLGAGQEQHLPHEAWHVVQQKQGRVQPTRQMKDSVAVNDEAGLETEADLMGTKAAQMQHIPQFKASTPQNQTHNPITQTKSGVPTHGVVQRRIPQISDIYSALDTDYDPLNNQWQETGRKIQMLLIRTMGQLPAVAKNQIEVQLRAENLDLGREIEDYPSKNALKGDLGRIAELMIDHHPDAQHPGDLQNSPTDNLAQKNWIKVALTAVANNYRAFARGSGDKIIQHVFGEPTSSFNPFDGSFETAKKNFGLAAETIGHFIENDLVLVDKRNDFNVKSVGALTGPNSMTLPKYFCATGVTDNEILTIGHEIMHAVGKGLIVDHQYRGSATFINLPMEKKLLNADHYAAVLAIRLGLATMNDVTQSQAINDPNALPNQGNQPNPELQRVHTSLESYFTFAWVMSLWVQENMTKIRKTSKEVNAPNDVSLYYKQLIRELSPMYGMTIHERLNMRQPVTDFPYIRDMDLVIAENIVADLGAFIGHIKRGQIEVVDNPWELPNNKLGILQERLNHLPVDYDALENDIKKQIFTHFLGQYSKGYDEMQAITGKLYAERQRLL